MYYLVAALIAGIAAGSFTHPYSFWGAVILVILLAMFVYFKKRLFLLTLFLLLIGLGGVLLARQSIEGTVRRHEKIVRQDHLVFEGNVVSNISSGTLHRIGVLTDEGIIRFSTFDLSITEGMSVQAVCEQFSEFFDLSRAASFDEIAACETVSLLHIAEGSPNFFSQIRSRFATIFDRALPSPESDVLAGMVIGKQSTFPKFLSNIFQATGTSHIIVLSGFNITILAFVVNGLFRRIGLGLRSGTIVSIAVIVLFDALVGFSAPVVRASIMVVLVLIARARGRPTSSFGVLGLSAAVMLVINPMLLRWSLSFQLSFAATCGVLLQERISPSFSFVPSFFGLRESVRTTFAATVTTLPITLFAFGGFSTVALVANAVVLPLVPLIMALGIPLLVIGCIYQQAALIFGAIPFVILRCITIFLEALAQLNFSYIEGLHVSSIFVVGWYLVLIFFVVRKKKKAKEYTPSLTQQTLFIFLCVASFVVLCLLVFMLRYPVASDPVLRIFDVGQGDAIHLRFTNGFDFLVDGGPDDTILSQLGRSLPYGDRTIEVMALTHPHADHVAGLLFVLQKYNVKEFWFTGASYESPLYESLLQTIEEKNIQTKIMLAGDERIFSEEPYVSVKVLSPDSSEDSGDINDTSLVLRVDIDDKSALLMGDAGKRVEEKIIASHTNDLPADVLKIGHHGSKTASSEEFLRAVHPSLGVISVGEKNSYELPDNETLQVFQGFKIPLFRTDACGTISVQFKKDDALHVKSACTP